MVSGWVCVGILWDFSGYFGEKMKFMKLGSKPDAFQAEGNSVR